MLIDSGIKPAFNSESAIIAGDVSLIGVTVNDNSAHPISSVRLIHIIEMAHRLTQIVVNATYACQLQFITDWQ
jgi:hypothetical protein